MRGGVGGGESWRRGEGEGQRGRGFGRGTPPPDHFVSLRVPPELAAPFFEAAHAALRGYDGGVLEPCLVRRETAHVTLAVVRLNREESKRSGKGEGGSGDGGQEGWKTAGASRNDASSRLPQQMSDPRKVEAATRALAAAAKLISEASLEGEGEEEEGKDGQMKRITTSVASALLSGLSLAPELGTFGAGKVLWLRPDDGFGGRALAAAERAVARALEAEAAALGLDGQSYASSKPARARSFTPHITLAKVPWSPPPGRSWRPAAGGIGGAAAPLAIPEEAHRGALAGIPRSALFGATELELCKMGSWDPEGRYYEVVATAKITAAEEE